MTLESKIIEAIDGAYEFPIAGSVEEAKKNMYGDPISDGFIVEFAGEDVETVDEAIRRAERVQREIDMIIENLHKVK